MANLIAWRKKQAGIASDNPNDANVVINSAPSTDSDLKTIYDRLTVNERLIIPYGTDKFDIKRDVITAQETQGTGLNHYFIYGNNYYAQTFKPSLTHELTYAKLYMDDAGTPSGLLTLGLQLLDGSGKPDGTNVCYGILTETSIVGTDWYSFYFTPTTVLGSGSSYALVAKTTTTSGGSNTAAWRYSTTNTYGSGTLLNSTDAGSSWSFGGGAGDFAFEEGGGTVIYPKGNIWIEGTGLRIFDENRSERLIVSASQVSDTPTDGLLDPITSNWAYDHVAAADPHVGYVKESEYGTQSILYAVTASSPTKLTIGTNQIVGRQTGNIISMNGSQTLNVLTAQAGTAFDWNNQSLNNMKSVNFTDPTTLTINGGTVTKTQSFHTIDTQGTVSLDDLDTILGGGVGDVVFLSAFNDSREVRITRNGNIRFQPEHMLEGFGFVSPSGASGTYYTAGFYAAPAADANLTQASKTVTYGSVNSPFGAYMFLVAGGVGSTDVGTVSIVISGTSTVGGTADTETLVSNITTMTTNAYYQTTKRWLGEVTYTLTFTGSATCSADFNYGKASYDSFDERLHTIKLIECFGRAGANDTGFDIQLLHHKTTGWVYSAAAFVPGATTSLCSLVSDYGINNDLVTNERFKWEHELNQSVNGISGEGFLIKIITTANKAVEFMNISIYAEVIPNDQHLKTTNQAVQMIYNGTNWMKV